MRRALRAAAALAGTAVLAAGAGCSANGQEFFGEGSNVIALLLPNAGGRYATFDEPALKEAVDDQCDDCSVVAFDAEQDQDRQNRQAAAAIDDGAKVLIVAPVDPGETAELVSKAHDVGAKVIAYDRFIEAADFYLTFDDAAVGRLQARSLVEAMGGAGGYLQLNGPDRDEAATAVRESADAVLAKSGLTLLTPTAYANPNSSAAKAEEYVGDTLELAGDPAVVQGVYAADDAQAAGVIKALTAAGVARDDLPPITGSGAELPAIRRVVAGTQYMTVFKSYFLQAERAADLAVALVVGGDIGEAGRFREVKTFRYEPVTVTVDDVQREILDPGRFTLDQICGKGNADACDDAGLG